MEFQGWPRTVENAERAYRVLSANGELERIAGLHAPAPRPAGFTPRPDEEEWLRTGPIAEVAIISEPNMQQASGPKCRISTGPSPPPRW
jgi:hypothetical protein